MKNSWRDHTPNWVEEPEQPNKRVAILGLFSIVYLGFFYALTARLAFWVFDAGVEWKRIFLFGVAASFTRGFDRFLNK